MSDPTQGDAATRVRPCPRCGGDELSHGYSWPPMQGSVECYADDCGALSIADNEAEAIAEWNAGRWSHRAVDCDEDGFAIIIAEPPALTPEARHDD